MLILGSTSPRRKELLESAGFTFKIVSPNFDESKVDATNKKVSDFVIELASGKAQSIQKDYPNDTIITADTIVVFNKEILGKPKDKQDAMIMLKKLNGNKHQVYTGVCIIDKNSVESFVSTADVYFKQMSDIDIENYVDSGEPMDKAGAYGIQGLGAKFIDRFEGDFHTIMGLPLKLVTEKLKKYIISE